MSAWLPILRMAQRSLTMLAVLLVLCFAAVYGFSILVGNLQQSLAQMQSTLQEQQATLQTHQEDLANVRTHIQAYESLRAQGLVGTPQRTHWVEQLQNSYQRLGLPGTIGVQLQAAKPLASPDAAANPNADPAGTGQTPLTHDLQFDIHYVHEGELLDLIDDFRANAKARFRVDSCELRDPSESGLTALCTLRFVTIPATIAAGATAPTGTGAQ